MTEVAGEPDESAADVEWLASMDYADRVTVEVRFRDGSGAGESDDFWLLRSNGAAWSRAWLQRQLVGLASVDGEGGRGEGGVYLLDVHEHTTEWGSSGAAIEIVLTLAQDQASNAVWAVLTGLGMTLSTRLKQKRASWGSYDDELNDDDVRNAALEAVERFRRLPPEALTVRSVEALGDNAVRIEVQDSSSRRVFTVEVKKGRGDVRLARVQKVTEPKPAPDEGG
jgi:hypothetical protein